MPHYFLPLLISMLGRVRRSEDAHLLCFAQCGVLRCARQDYGKANLFRQLTNAVVYVRCPFCIMGGVVRAAEPIIVSRRTRRKACSRFIPSMASLQAFIPRRSYIPRQS